MTCALTCVLFVGRDETIERINVTVRLDQPIGVTLRADLTVKSLDSGAQLELLGGIKPGDLLLEAGGTSLLTPDQFGSIIQERCSQGTESLELAFETKVRLPFFAMF